MLHEGKLGVQPPGALGVAFFVHANAECFIGRGGDGITQPLKTAGVLKLLDGGKMRSVPLEGRIFANLLEADAMNHMPELLFICCNPDQLGLFTQDLTRFMENLAERSKLRSSEDIRRHVPILLVLPNGILAEQTIRTYEEQINESMLMGRLPGVTEPMVPAILDRVVRGVSFQAGGRRGSGAQTLYLLERKGLVQFAGGGEVERNRIEAILGTHAYPFQHARGVPGTRVEFDKAMISIVLNVGGLIHTVKPNGELIDLRMGDLCKDATKADFVNRITQAVFDVGKSAGAYPPDAVFEEIWSGHRATIMAHAEHVTSSLKSFRDALSSGLKSVKLFSNEEWILTPLSRYAANSGMYKEEALFLSLKKDVQAAMARAIHYRDGGGDGKHLGAVSMNLTAQRNIGLELFEAGPENVVAVGTMLDNEHLIKLEINIYLPDEQITRSKLSMIRVPFPVCREVEHVAEKLVGLRIERGVLSQIVRRVGGHVGCSHIKELATNIVYFLASYLIRRRAGFDPVSLDFISKPADERFALTKGLLSDSCLAYCQTTPQGLDEQIGIKRMGAEHTHPSPLGDYERSLGAMFTDRVQRYGDRTYMRERQGSETHSMKWNEFGRQVFQIARHLLREGIRPGDRIAMISENRSEMFQFELATVIIGAVSVPVYAGYLPRQIAHLLGHARPKWVVVSGKHQLNKIEKDRYPWVRKYFCMDHDAGCDSWGAEDFRGLTQEGGASATELDERIHAVQPDDLCVVMYTSGTTGMPKGVRLTHRNLLSQQKAIGLLWDLSEKDSVMGYLPWHHSFGGLFERFLTLYHGCEYCLDDSRGKDMDRLIDNWKAYNPSLFFSVPRVHDLLLARCRGNPDVDRTVFGGRLRFVFTAGASLPEPVGTGYRQRNIPVMEGWGLTETSPCVTLTALDNKWKSGLVGFPIPGVTIRLDADQEILVKGPNVMDGYLDDEEATAHVIDEDGWFHSGDLGEFTKEGLRIFGRKDGAFKLTTGEKVHPQRIENVLVNESPYISLAVVVGSGKDGVGAAIFPAMSLLREWADRKGITAENLVDAPAAREFFAEELARINANIEVKYQRISRAVLIGEEPSLANGELTPSGKLVRREILDHHAETIGKLFSSDAKGAVIVVHETELQEA